jgi:hypothetical protein
LARLGNRLQPGSAHAIGSEISTTLLNRRVPIVWAVELAALALLVLEGQPHTDVQRNSPLTSSLLRHLPPSFNSTGTIQLNHIAQRIAAETRSIHNRFHNRTVNVQSTPSNTTRFLQDPVYLPGHEQTERYIRIPIGRNLQHFVTRLPFRPGRLANSVTILP